METKIRQLKYPEIINGHMFSYQTWNSVTSRACVCLLFVWLGYPELILTLVNYHGIGDDNDGDGSGWKTLVQPAVVRFLLDWLHLLNKRGTKFIWSFPKKSYGKKIPRLTYQIGDDNDEDGGGWKTPAHPAVVCSGWLTPHLPPSPLISYNIWWQRRW